MRATVFLLLVLLTIGLSAPVTAQGNSFTPITPENANRVALAALFSGENIPTPHHLSAVAFSPDGTQLALAMETQVLLISTQTFEIQHVLEASNQLLLWAFHLTYSPDSSILVAFGDDFAPFRVWDAQQGQLLFSGTVTLHYEGVSLEEARFSPDDPNQLILFAQDGDFASLWDIDAKRELDRISLRRCRETNFTHSPLCQLFDVWPNREADLLLAQLLPPEAPCFSPDFLGFSSNGERFALIEQCDTDQRRESEYQLYRRDSLERLEQHTLEDAIKTAVLNVDGSLIFVVGYSQDAGWLLAPSTAERFNILPGSRLRYTAQATFSPAGNLLAVALWEELRVFAVFDCTVTADHEVNLRTAPSTESRLVGVLLPGERLGIYGSETVDSYTWLRLANNWWVRRDVVQMQGDCPQ